MMLLKRLGQLSLVCLVLLCVVAFSALTVSAEEPDTGAAPQIVEEIAVPQEAVLGVNQPVMNAAAQKAVSQYVFVDSDKVTINGAVSLTAGADDNTVIFTGADGVAVSYSLNGGALTIVQGQSADLSLDISGNLALTKLDISVDVVSTAMGDDAQATIDLSNADITIEAQKVLFETEMGAVLQAKSLKIDLQAADVELAVTKLAAKRLKASFDKFDMELGGEFTVNAQVNESRIVDLTDEVAWGEDLEEMLDLLDGSTKYYASVRPIYINIPIQDSSITASAITVEAVTEILMNTKSDEMWRCSTV